MTEDKMNQIVGRGSMLAMIIAQIKYTVFTDPTYGWCPELTDELKDTLAAQNASLLEVCEITYKSLNDNQGVIVNYQWGSTTAEKTAAMTTVRSSSVLRSNSVKGE